MLYSDTDSIFLTLEGKTRIDAHDFVQNINKGLPGLMELDFQGFYPSGIFVSAKAGAFGAKKKYALLSENGSLKIKGFESVRRNWSSIAKESQEAVLAIILKEHDVKKASDYIKKVVDGLRNKKIPQKVRKLIAGKEWYHQRFDGCPMFIGFISESEPKLEERKPKGTEADIRENAGDRGNSSDSRANSRAAPSRRIGLSCLVGVSRGAEQNGSGACWGDYSGKIATRRRHGCCMAAASQTPEKG